MLAVTAALSFGASVLHTAVNVADVLLHWGTPRGGLTRTDSCQRFGDIMKGAVDGDGVEWPL